MIASGAKPTTVRKEAAPSLLEATRAGGFADGPEKQPDRPCQVNSDSSDPEFRSSIQGDRGISAPMTPHFGFNCRHFIPRKGMCRRAFHDVGEREVMRCCRWVTAEEAMVYLGVTGTQLVERVGPSDIKRTNAGNVLVRITADAAWNWDHCPLTQAGGQCGFYDEHDGPKISRAREVDRVSGKHPNSVFEPDEDAIVDVERALVQRVKARV
jgi:hypothetical protein